MSRLSASFEYSHGKRVRPIVVAAVLALGSQAFADSITVDFASTQSLKGRGSFTGTAVYDAATDQLSLDITNTSVRGALTAFAFEVPTGDSAEFLRPSGSPWKDERNHKGIVKAAPYGKFGGGAGVHGHWGSTDAKDGVAAGTSETFVFDIAGSTASSLTTNSFFDSTTPQIVATFAGFKHQKTDRAEGYSDGTAPGGIHPDKTEPLQGGNDPVAVPLPSSALTGMSLLGLLASGGILRRTLRRAK